MECYDLTELGGPGVAFGCVEQNGQHINKDHFMVEVERMIEAKIRVVIGYPRQNQVNTVQIHLP